MIGPSTASWMPSTFTPLRIGYAFVIFCACLLCVVATALAVELGGSTKTLASKDPQGSEIAELRAVQETVVQAQHDLDGMNQDEQDAAAMGSEAPAKKASDARADLGEAFRWGVLKPTR